MAAEDQRAPASVETRTKIDLLLDLLKANGKMDLNSISNNLAVPSNIVEGWAKLLEGNNLVRITYEVGKMYVEPAVIAKEDIRMEVAKAGVKKSVLEQSVTEQMLDLNNFTKLVEDLGKTATSAESVYKQKIPEIQSMVLEINRINDEIGSSYKEMSAVKDKTLGEFNLVSKEMYGIIKKIDSIDSDNTKRSISESVSKIEEAVKSANDSIITVDGITKDKEAELEAVRKSFEQQIAKVNKSIGESLRNVDTNLKMHRAQIAKTADYLIEEEKVAKETANELKSFDRKRTLAVKRLNEIMKDFQDKYAKIQSSVERRMDILADNMGKIQNRVAQIKGSFGEASQIIDSVSEVRKNVDILNSQILASKAELAKLKERLDALSDLQKIPIEKRSQATEAVETAVKKSSERVENIRNGVQTNTTTIKKLSPKKQDRNSRRGPQDKE
jgi:DNA repair exonuclease SbcCD ATPase subunit